MAGSHVSDRNKMLAWAFVAQVEQPRPILIPLGLTTGSFLYQSIPSLQKKKKENQDSMNTSIQQVLIAPFIYSNLISQWFIETT
jgi:hypothetical protein